MNTGKWTVDYRLVGGNQRSFFLSFVKSCCLTQYQRRCNEMEILTWQARKDKNVTLVKLSALTGISKSTLNNIENGRVSPTIKQLETIAKALGVKISDLYESQYK